MKKITAYPLFLLSAFILSVSFAIGQDDPGPKTEDDFTYGKGGKKTTRKNKFIKGVNQYTTKISGIDMEFKTTEHTVITIEDPKKVVREVHIDKKLENGYNHTIDEFYDCKGNPVYKKQKIKDITGAEVYFLELRYKDGKPISGIDRGVDIDGKKFKRKFNPENLRFENTEDVSMNTETSGEIDYVPDKTTCAAIASCASKLDIFAGFSLYNADFEPDRENMPGWNVELTFNFPSKQYREAIKANQKTDHFYTILGLIADASGHYKKDGDVSFSKHFFLAGPQLTFQKEKSNCPKLIPVVHLLAGVSKFHYEVDIPGFGKVEENDNSFALAAGGSLNLNVSKKFAIRLFQVDYVLTRFGDQTQNNFRYAAGLIYRDMFKPRHFQ